MSDRFLDVLSQAMQAETNAAQGMMAQNFTTGNPGIDQMLGSQTDILGFLRAIAQAADAKAAENQVKKAKSRRGTKNAPKKSPRPTKRKKKKTTNKGSYGRK